MVINTKIPGSITKNREVALLSVLSTVRDTKMAEMYELVKARFPEDFRSYILDVSNQICHIGTETKLGYPFIWNTVARHGRSYRFEFRLILYNAIKKGLVAKHGPGNYYLTKKGFQYVHNNIAEVHRIRALFRSAERVVMTNQGYEFLTEKALSSLTMSTRR